MPPIFLLCSKKDISSKHKNTAHLLAFSVYLTWQTPYTGCSLSDRHLSGQIFLKHYFRDDLGINILDLCFQRIIWTRKLSYWIRTQILSHTLHHCITIKLVDISHLNITGFSPQHPVWGMKKGTLLETLCLTCLTNNTMCYEETSLHKWQVSSIKREGDGHSDLGNRLLKQNYMSLIRQNTCNTFLCVINIHRTKKAWRKQLPLISESS